MGRGQPAGDLLRHSARARFPTSRHAVRQRLPRLANPRRWAVYYKFFQAGHQSCIAHLIRRCRDMAAVSTAAAVQFPLGVRGILEKGLALRDRYEKQEISRHGLWTATGRLEVQLDRLLERHYHDSANRRLAQDLCRERPYLFTFLYCPGLDATNNAAERALRPLVVARKNSREGEVCPTAPPGTAMADSGRPRWRTADEVSA